MWNELLQTHAYWVLALGCFLEGETLLLLAGLAAHRGLLNPVAVVAIAAVAGFAGDQFWFWLGRRHGAALLARFPSVARRSTSLHGLMERWHEAVIIGVRFAYGLRIAGPLLLGMSTLSAWRFAGFNAMGALLWACVVAAIGWAFGAAAQALLGELRHVEGWLFAALLVAVLLVLLLRWRRASR
jgi:membrane protein DedA with SNARE-associated domain